MVAPVDFYDPSRKALQVAEKLAGLCSGKIVLLHVVEPLMFPEIARSLPALTDDEKFVGACKAKLLSLARTSKVPAEMIDRLLVRHGAAYHEIVDAARSLKADLIVIGSHGHTALQHATLGSVAERVVRHAHCPVLVVREAAEQRA